MNVNTLFSKLPFDLQYLCLTYDKRHYKFNVKDKLKPYNKIKSTKNVSCELAYRFGNFNYYNIYNIMWLIDKYNPFKVHCQSKNNDTILIMTNYININTYFCLHSICLIVNMMNVNILCEKINFLTSTRLYLIYVGAFIFGIYSNASKYYILNFYFQGKYKKTKFGWKLVN